MTEEQLLVEIATALEVSADSLSIQTVNSDIEQWDSLGHISILARLDSLFANVTERYPELAEATSIMEILSVLKRDGQL